MSSSLVGLVFMFLFAVSQGVRDALFGNVFQSVSFLFVAALAFGPSCLLFIGLSLMRRPTDLRRLLAVPGKLVAVNIATAAAWLGFFFGLRHLEPAVVATLYNGIGPLVVFALAGLGWSEAKATSGAIEKACYVGVAAALAALAAVVLTNRSGLTGAGVAVQAGAIAITVFSGVMITIGHTIARQLNDSGIDSDAVMGARYLLTFAAAVGLELALGAEHLRPASDRLPTLAMAAFGLIVLPSFLVQLGISRASPLAVNVFRALGPVFVFVVQQVDGRLRFSDLTLACIVAFCLCSITASMLRGWREVTDGGPGTSRA